MKRRWPCRESDGSPAAGFPVPIEVDFLRKEDREPRGGEGSLHEPELPVHHAAGVGAHGATGERPACPGSRGASSLEEETEIADVIRPAHRGWFGLGPGEDAGAESTRLVFEEGAVEQTDGAHGRQVLSAHGRPGRTARPDEHRGLVYRIAAVRRDRSVGLGPVGSAAAHIENQAQRCGTEARDIESKVESGLRVAGAFRGANQEIAEPDSPAHGRCAGGAAARRAGSTLPVSAFAIATAAATGTNSTVSPTARGTADLTVDAAGRAMRRKRRHPQQRDPLPGANHADFVTLDQPVLASGVEVDGLRP